MQAIPSFSFHELCTPNATLQKEAKRDFTFSAKCFVTRKEGSVTDSYVIGEKLGSGGYGQVYECVHKETKIERAVKILKRKKGDGKGSADAQVIKEFEILKQMDHPNILKQIEMYCDEDNYYIVTEICRGGELLAFYFTLNSTKKINVFSVGENHDFLSKIYTKNEFNFASSSLQNINYNILEKQELIILNELENLPNVLTTFLQKHLNEGKSLVVIPSVNTNINSYNSFFNKLRIGNISYKQSDTLKITNINFKNPFFKNVFYKDIQNFQNPVVKSYYNSSFGKASILLNFENQQSYINQVSINKGNLFWISSALNTKNSNFTNSPLVVPVFYNFGKFSVKYPKPYYTIGETNFIDVATVLKKDEVLTINNNENSFIPLQQLFTSKVSLETRDNPKTQGLYTVNKGNTIIETIAFNYNSTESELNFLNIKEAIKDNKNLEYSESIATVLQKNTDKNKVTWLWKWFLALAIVSLIFEILILKFFKP